MPDIPITDSLQATADIQIKDTGLLSKLLHLNFSDVPLIRDFGKPIDQCSMEGAKFGFKFGPSIALPDAASLIIQSAVAGELSILTPEKKKLFDDDDFCPAIPIAANECWIGLELEASVEAKVSGTVDGFGVNIGVAPNVSFTRYVSIPSSDQFQKSLESAFSSFSIACTAAALRNQSPGTVNVAEIGGTVKFSASYSVPLNVNALASADLPFNYKLNVAPAVTLKLGGSIALTGDFITRAHRISEAELQLGLYKKKGTTFSASFTAGAGVEPEIGATDIVSTVLDAVLPGVDCDKAGLTGDAAGDLSGALKDCIDHSLSITMNVGCSAGVTDESAIIYSIDLSKNVAATDTALSSALRGDWTALDALSNATPLRNIFKETRDSKHTINVNLLGVYNAVSLEEFVKTCTVLHDDNGHVVITDKLKATQLAAAGAPYAADANKLRSAVAEGFVATVTYAAGAGQKLQLQTLSAKQTFLRYARKMSRSDMRQGILLARALNLLQNEDWETTLAATSSFAHAKFDATTEYDGAAAMRLFFSDPVARTPRSRDELERIGRQVKVALLDPTDPATPARTRALNTDAIWKAMDDNGDVAAFETLPGLSGLRTTDLGAIGADWTDIAWWTEAMLKVAPKLTDLLKAVDQSSQADPTQDPNFMSKRKALAHVLGGVAKNSRSAFGDGWGLAVMFRLAGAGVPVTMDICYNSLSKHYPEPAKTAVAIG